MISPYTLPMLITLIALAVIEQGQGILDLRYDGTGGRQSGDGLVLA